VKLEVSKQPLSWSATADGANQKSLNGLKPAISESATADRANYKS